MANFLKKIKLLPLCKDVTNIIQNILFNPFMLINEIQSGGSLSTFICIDNTTTTSLHKEYPDLVYFCIYFMIEKNRIDMLKYYLDKYNNILLTKRLYEDNRYFNYLTPYNNIDVIKYLHENKCLNIHHVDDLLYFWAVLKDDIVLMNYLQKFLHETHPYVKAMSFHYRCVANKENETIRHAFNKKYYMDSYQISLLTPERLFYGDGLFINSIL
jgi:hypothetical protein